jgi:hypothetical protein
VDSDKSEVGSDGISDSSYIIDKDNQDNFLLMAPVSVFDVDVGTVSHTILK